MPHHDYSMLDYTEMIGDRVRTDAYREALRACVRPGSVVVDIGTATGFLAMLASQCGARRVYAIDPSTTVLIGRELAALNGYGETIEFIQQFSSTVTLPEPVDVIVSDLRGVTPVFQAAIAAILDARDRWLAPGGCLIPQVDRLWGALARKPALMTRRRQATDADVLGINMLPARRYVMNSIWRGPMRADEILVDPTCWTTLDYRTLRSPNVSGSLRWRIDEPMQAHGVAIWFDSRLCDGIGYDSAPGRPNCVYGQALLPFDEPIDLQPPDTISIDISAWLVQGEYVWRWETYLSRDGVARERRFSQSNFYSRARARTAHASE